MATTKLTRTETAGNRQIWTFSAWVKRGTITTTDGQYLFSSSDGSNNYNYLQINPSDQLRYLDYTSGNNSNKITTQLFRDCAAYYHIVCAVDTTDGVAEDRVKLYVNGERITAFGTNVNHGASDDTEMNVNTYTMSIGSDQTSSGGQYWVGLMSNVAFVDGTALAPTEFGETDSTSGIWKFKAPGGGITWGTNGFWLKGENSAALGTDSSGQTNTLTTSGSPTQSIDTPSNVYCALNTAVRHQGTISHANTRYDNGGSSWYGVPSTFGFEKGKWFYEYKCTTITSWSQVGLMSSKPAGGYNDIYSTYVGDNSGGVALNSGNGDIYQNGSSGTTWFSGGLSAGDIIGVAIDADNSKIYFSKDGVWGNSSDPVAGTNGQTLDSNFTDYKPYLPCFSVNNFVIDVNFGTGYFGSTAVSSAGTSSTDDDSVWEFDCPTGYYGINTKNINTYG